MVKPKKPRTKKTKSRSEKNTQERYSIDLNIHDKDMALMVSDRRCYMCCKSTEDEGSHFDIDSVLNSITSCCCDKDDYLLSDRPIKESLFRVILMNGNNPITLEEIHGILSDKWALAPYPRDISIKLLKNLINNADEYGIIVKNN